MRTSGYIHSGIQRLHYLQWGHGAQLLLAFHGYGNDADLFAPLAAQVAGRFTTIAVDLPHHGQSEWPAAHPWTKEDLVAMVRAFMQERKVQQITLIGFSLGGRVCLTLAEQVPELIDRLVLVASDGLVPNAFYQFVTRNFAGKRLFHHFLDKPERYLQLIGWLQQHNWIDASRRKFVEHHAGLPAARAFLKKVWPNLYLLVPDQQQVRRNIEQHKIDTEVYMGKQDRVIPLKHAYTFAAGHPHIRVHELDKGHRILDEATIALIAQQLNAATSC